MEVLGFVISTVTEAFGAPADDRHIHIWRKSMNTPPRTSNSVVYTHLLITVCSL